MTSYLKPARSGTSPPSVPPSPVASLCTGPCAASASTIGPGAGRPRAVLHGRRRRPPCPSPPPGPPAPPARRQPADQAAAVGRRCRGMCGRWANFSFCFFLFFSFLRVCSVAHCVLRFSLPHGSVPAHGAWRMAVGVFVRRWMMHRHHHHHHGARVLAGRAGARARAQTPIQPTRRPAQSGFVVAVAVAAVAVCRPASSGGSAMAMPRRRPARAVWLAVEPTTVVVFGLVWSVFFGPPMPNQPHDDDDGGGDKVSPPAHHTQSFFRPPPPRQDGDKGKQDRNARLAVCAT
jgi:hypothetical protein